MNPSKKEYLETLLSNDPNRPIYIVIAPSTKGAQVPDEYKHEYFVGVVLPLKDQLITHAGVSGRLPKSGGYLNMPWSAVQWIGRDWGTDAAVGVAWNKELDGAGQLRSAQERALVRGWKTYDGGLFGPRERGVA